MANAFKENQQGNMYDKIFRENMEAALPGIIAHLLNLHIVNSVELPDDIQHTKERKPDLLKKVTDKTGKTFVLHIEYQTKSDQEMPYRMAEYNIMLLRKYKLPVKQYVIFIGSGKANMATSIVSENFSFHYDIISLSSIDYKIFLKSAKPEEKILAILANFENEEPVAAIKNILQAVKDSTDSSFAENRYFNQLRVLMQLRNFKNQFDKAMESISTFFKEENDPLFYRGEVKGLEKGREEGLEKGLQKGLQKGRQEGREEVISNLLENLGLPDEQVARIANVPLKLVQKIRKKLQK
jgi:predicted transposase/invertase (TIGR01784 family)